MSADYKLVHSARIIADIQALLHDGHGPWFLIDLRDKAPAFACFVPGRC